MASPSPTPVKVGVAATGGGGEAKELLVSPQQQTQAVTKDKKDESEKNTKDTKDTSSQNSNPKSKRSFKLESSLGPSTKSSSSNSRAQGKLSGGFIVTSFRKVFAACESVWRYVQRIFTIPLVREPISFFRDEDFTTAGDRILGEHENEETLDMIEAACNYNENTGVLFDKILEDRKESAMSKKKMSASLDFSNLAPWNDSILDRLQSIFQVFDASGDGLVDLDEMTSVMIEFGDKSTTEDRRKVFTTADTLGKGALNFNEFVEMFHYITVKAPDQVAPAVVETFRLVDRNMARIRGLDVVQQLQTGLF